MSETARTAGRTERPGIQFIPRQFPGVLALGRHDVASELPAAIQGIVQKGLLDRTFQEALRPEWVFPGICDSMPWQGAVGDEKKWTRTGLMSPSPTPVAATADATAGSYSKETWSAVMAKYGKSLDTNVLASAVALASLYLNDVKTLGIHSGQSMNQAARDTIYRAYAGGRTWVTTGGGSSTTLPVKDTAGFGYTSVLGDLTAVAGSNPLTVTVNGVPNTVTAVSVASGPGNLTLGTGVAATAGWAVVAANAPTSIRPSGSTAYDLDSADLATLSLFRAARSRLKKMSVPMIGGAYTAFVTEDTINELYTDPSFENALRGNIESPVWRDMAIGRINGVDFVPNNEVVTLLAGSVGTLTVNRCLVVGAGALMWCPLQGLGDLLRETGVQGVPNISMIAPANGVEVALTVRPPLDRFGNVVATTWQAVGGYGVPTDLENASGDAALMKRAVLVEHA
jgi:hypothetical protein